MSNFRRLEFGTSIFCIFVFNSFLLAGNFNIAELTPDKNTYVTLSEDGSSVTGLEFVLDDLTQSEVFMDGNKFDQYQIGSETIRRKAGYPALPSVVKFMLIPPQSGVEVNIHEIKSRVETEINPLPMVTQFGEGADPERVKLLYSDHEIVASEIKDQSDDNGFWPPEVVRVGKPSIMRGYRIIQLTINPLRYNITTKELEVIESMNFSLDYNSDKNRVNLIKNPNRDVSSRAVNRIVQDLVLNPPPVRDDPVTGGSIMYIIGEWDDIEEDLQPLVEWRRRMGWTVEVVRVRSSRADDIRDAIQEAYENWDIPPEHVVICGDTDGPNGNQYIRGFFDVRVNANFPYETDHKFVEVAGDDYLPEATVGRLIFETRAMCRGVVEKTVLYESDPFIGEDEEIGWQRRAAVAAVDRRSGASSIDICRWTKELLERHDYTRVNEMYWAPGNERPNASNYITTNINEGLGIYLHRGWTNMNGFGHEQVNNLRNERMLPFVVLATCNTGDYAEHIYNRNFSYSERFAYYTGGGAIGALGFAGASHTAYNNLLSASTIKAFVIDGVYSQGWALMKAKIELFRNYFERDDIDHAENRGMEAWECEYYIFNLMGDPVVDLFTDTPNILVVDAPEVITTGMSIFETTITFEENEEPVEDALVCLYKPGDDGFQIAARTDSEGHVTFSLDPEWTQEGDIQFTVTGHNLMTVMEDYEIEEPDMFLGNGGFALDDDEEGESNGDGDGVANQLERLELAVQIANFGNEVPEGQVTAVLSTEMPHLEVVNGEFEAEAAPEAGESIEAAFTVDIGGGFPNGKNAEFILTVTIADTNVWVSSIFIPVEGPEFVFESFEWVEDELEPGGMASINLRIRNIGTKPAPALTGSIISITPTVGAVQPNGDFPAIDEGEAGTNEDAYRLSAHPLHIAGSRGDFGLRLESQTGFVDTCYFGFNVSVGQEGDPFGPDAYGYVCFDNTDEDWFMAPEYDWIEIDPERGGQGTDTELTDRAAEGDESMVMNLPFTFRYYGQDFDEITICTNGWAAFGDHEVIATAKNRRIPGGMVGSSMLCPFWEDLRTTNDGGIYTWFDEENDLFIIEWSNMRKLGPRNNNEPIETFEIVLYDPERYPSFTGDGDIKFQYLEITDDRSCFTTWDVPFATVGLGDPDQSTGLEYTFGGDLNPAAAPLEEGRAILFSTLVEFNTANFHGQVLDEITGDPVPEAMVISTYGFSALTDENGMYEIADVLVDTSVQYTITFSKMFFNDSTSAPFNVEPDDTLEVNFRVLRPEFNLESDAIDVAIEPENANDFYFPLTNTGSGVVSFSSSLDLRDVNGGRDDIFDIYLTIPITKTVLDVNEEGDSLFLGNNKIKGNTFIDSLFYVAGGGDTRGDGHYAQFYRYHRNGEFLDSLQLPWIVSRGIKDMAYDSRYILAVYDDFIYRFEPEPEDRDTVKVAVLVDSMRIEGENNLGAIAVDSENEVIYACNLLGDVYVIDYEGNVVNSYELRGEDNRSLRKYGMAWYAEQPDSLNLLILIEVESIPTLIGLNPASGEYHTLHVFDDLDDSSILGIDVTGRWNSSVWTLHALVDDGDGDYLNVYELAPNTTWLFYSPQSGILQAGQDTVVHIRVESGTRPLDRYWLMLRYDHTADPGFQDIPIVMNIVEAADVPGIPELPMEFALEQNWPNPFNPTTTLSYSIPDAGAVNLTVFDTMGRSIIQLVDEYQDRGRYQVTFDGSSLPTGMYVYQLESANKIISKKMVLLK